MGRMRLYTHPDGRTAVHERGFSWLAAVALPVWALQRRLPLLAVATFAAGLLPGMLGLLLELSPGWSMGLSAAYLLACGMAAAPLQAWWLRRRGWVLTAEEPLPGPRPAP